MFTFLAGTFRQNLGFKGKQDITILSFIPSFSICFVSILLSLHRSFPFSSSATFILSLSALYSLFYCYLYCLFSKGTRMKCTLHSKTLPSSIMRCVKLFGLPWVKRHAYSRLPPLKSFCLRPSSSASVFHYGNKSVDLSLEDSADLVRTLSFLFLLHSHFDRFSSSSSLSLSFPPPGC